MPLPRLRPLAFRAAAITSAAALAAAGFTAISVAAPGHRSNDTQGFELGARQPSVSSVVHGSKAPSSALARTPQNLTHITSDRMIPVLIKYDYDAIASYAGGQRGLAATSPSVTGHDAAERTDAVRAYSSFVVRQESTISQRITKVVPRADINQRFRTVYGGVSAFVPGNAVSDILKVPGVVAVQRDALRQPLTDSSSEFINADAIYDAVKSRKNAGKGTILADIDTGVWPEHRSFADKGNLSTPPGPARTCEFGDNPLTPADDPFQCTNKLIGGDATLDTYEQAQDDLVYPGTARDAGGHGSHTSGTAAGNVLHGVQTIGPKIDRINGIAPGAWIIEYRALGPQGGYSSDLMTAVQHSILDGADVINYSISGGSDPLTDPTELAFLDAYNAGVFVSASAGNSGPGAATSDHLSPWVTTVAASTQERAFTSILTLTADNGDTYTVKGSSIMPGVGPAPVASAADAPYSDATCLTPAAAGTFDGKIVVCERGGNGRVEKGYNVLQGGAAGMILYNPALADTETDNHWLPAVHLADGTDLVAFVDGHTGITGSFTDGKTDTGKGDVMAAFSSRGPGGNFLKPDITGPGVQILAATTPTPGAVVDGPPGQQFMSIAGTSMSAPHIAGAALLIKSVHRKWTPGQIKSAMMTQSIRSVLKEDEKTHATPFDMGAGRIDVGRAADAPITISDSGDNMAAYTADPQHAIDLNLPSLNAPVLPGRITTYRTLTNTRGKALTVKASSAMPQGSSMTVSPSRFTIKKKGTKTVKVTIKASTPVDKQKFGRLFFKTNKGNLHLPVAFIHTQGSVSATQDCDPAKVAVDEKSVCTVSLTNEGFDDQAVKVSTSTGDPLKMTSSSLGAVYNNRVTALRSLSGAQPGVPSVGTATDTPGGGYLPLGDFGIDPMAIGDEDIVNFDVPAFTYNGRRETQIGVDSNGYLVVGGGTSDDNKCCDLPGTASSAAPNNVLAPFWSDLNGEGAPGITVGELSDGTNSWIVVQWEVNDFGTSDGRAFQVWLGEQGAQDISFEYSVPQAAPADSLQTYQYGAENEAGDGDVVAELPDGSSQRVTSTDPTPGGSLTYTVTVKGLRKGNGNVHTEMTAEKVPGTTVLDTPIRVSKE